MKKRVFVFLLWLLLPVLSAATILNICDYGAVPNDSNDDTDAVEKALADALKLRKGAAKSSIITAPEIRFPYGRYIISRPLRVPACAALVGEGAGSILLYKGNKEDTVFTIRASNERVENLIFVGGKTHLQFSNANIDTTLITIRNCRFYYASGIALRIVPSDGKDHMSALTVVENSIFERNYQCVENYGDLFKMRDCWVHLKQPEMADGPAFINRSGKMMLENICGVPCANPPHGKEYLQNARWIDNYGALRCYAMRFGGECGGLPIVYHYSDGRSERAPMQGAGNEIIIENSCIFPGQHKRANKGVIRLFELPCQIRLEGNHGQNDRPVIILDGKLAERLKTEPVDQNKLTMYMRYTFRNNVGPTARMPQEIMPLFSKDSEIEWNIKK